MSCHKSSSNLSQLMRCSRRHKLPRFHRHVRSMRESIARPSLQQVLKSPRYDSFIRWCTDFTTSRQTALVTLTASYPQSVFVLFLSKDRGGCKWGSEAVQELWTETRSRGTWKECMKGVCSPFLLMSTDIRDLRVFWNVGIIFASLLVTGCQLWRCGYLMVDHRMGRMRR